MVDEKKNKSKKGKGKPKGPKPIPKSYKDNTRKGKFQIDGVVTLVPYANNSQAFQLSSKPYKEDRGMYPAYRPSSGFSPSPNKQYNSDRLRFLDMRKAAGGLSAAEADEWNKLTRPAEKAAGEIDPSTRVSSTVADGAAKLGVDAVEAIIE